jgi:hypothetical protein
MKRKTLIITDPKKMFERYSNQPRVSRERAVHSILVQNESAFRPSHCLQFGQGFDSPRLHLNPNTEVGGT